MANPLRLILTSFRHGEKTQIAQSYAYEPKPASFKLLPGVYNIKVYSKSGKAVKEIREIIIRSGDTNTIKVTF